MLRINKKDTSIFEFDVDIEGASPNDIKESRFSISNGDQITSFLGIINSNVVRFTLKDILLSAGDYKCFVEFFIKDFYFKPIEDTIQIKDINISIKNLTTEPIVHKMGSVMFDGITESKSQRAKVTLKG